MKIFRETNKNEFLRRYINIWSSLYKNESEWLSPREKEYFMVLVEMNAGGHDLLSREVNKFLEDEKQFRNRGVNIYRYKLKSKGWLIQTKNGLELPKAFNFTEKFPLPEKINFKFGIEWTTE